MLAEGEVCLNDERIKMSKTGFPLVPNTSRFKGKETFFVFLLIRFIRLQAFLQPRQRNPAGITEMISLPPHRKPFQDSGFCKEVKYLVLFSSELGNAAGGDGRLGRSWCDGTVRTLDLLIKSEPLNASHAFCDLHLPAE